ncbi:conserved hypothetical protein [Ixodes scapularis]|uniref:Uncharacterized protein n=1 Tax=Ixodes scapularis TaxID=6945 RepID=B7PFB9_IXOSC|nr:conserved hypothetical protein [Ixodes scapularis]|eukprot:XP_002433891.1 conserved hypothetical protein [Ixodes scapularis]
MKAVISLAVLFVMLAVACAGGFGLGHGFGGYGFGGHGLGGYGGYGLGGLGGFGHGFGGYHKAQSCRRSFNLVMRTLAVELRKIPHLGLTFYVDEITMWVDPKGTYLTTAEVVGDRPTVEHLLWECPGYQNLWQQHLPRHVRTFLEWTTPGNDAQTRDTLLSL